MRNLLISIGLVVLLSGCYGGIHLTTSFGFGAAYSVDSTQVVFVKFIEFYRPAKGISAFPDGGQPKMLYVNSSLYKLDSQSQELLLIYDFGSIRAHSARLRTNVRFTDSSVIFKIAPAPEWKLESKGPSRGVDSTMHNNSNDWLIYDLNTKIIKRIEEFDADKIPYRKVSFEELSRLTSHFTMEDWGINLNEICPQTKRKRLKGIIQLKNNSDYRDVIIDLLAPELSNKEIETTIKGINKYVDSKQGYERSKLIFLKERTIEKLESIKKPESE
jgi:hypothetical protein